MCVCARVRERTIEREMYIYKCVYVCVYERERDLLSKLIHHLRERFLLFFDSLKRFRGILKPIQMYSLSHTHIHTYTSAY